MLEGASIIAVRAAALASFTRLMAAKVVASSHHLLASAGSMANAHIHERRDERGSPFRW
jgi:hypothetical protein